MSAGNSKSVTREFSCDHNQEIRRLCVHVRTLYALLVCVSLVTIVLSLLFFGELQKLQSTTVAIDSAGRGKTHSTEFLARFDPSNSNSSKPGPQSIHALGSLRPSKNEEYSDVSSHNNTDDQFRKRSSYFRRRHLPSDDDDNFPGLRNLSVLPSSTHGTLKENEDNARPTSNRGSVDGENFDAGSEWVWLTTYSRIPVSRSDIIINTQLISANHLLRLNPIERTKTL